MKKPIFVISAKTLALAIAITISGAAIVVPIAAAAQTISRSAMDKCNFPRDLKVGSKGDDVMCLQNSLIAGGYLNTSATGYFGTMTEAAVIVWQKTAGVSGTGYFGSKSRAAYDTQVAVPADITSISTPNAVPQNTPPPNTTLCNGIYYTSCPTGNNLVCPSGGGGAYCAVSDSPIESTLKLLNELQQNSPLNALIDQKNILAKKKDGQNISEEEIAKLTPEQAQIVRSNDISEISIQIRLLNDQIAGYANSVPNTLRLYSQLSQPTDNSISIVYAPSGCDYFITETSSGYELLEWYGGNIPAEGQTYYGDVHGYGFKDIYRGSSGKMHVWEEDYLLSKDNALTQYEEKCQ